VIAHGQGRLVSFCAEQGLMWMDGGQCGHGSSSPCAGLHCD
jgi:hypothetical protein